MKTHSLRDKLREATWSAILEAAEQVAAREGGANASLHAIAEQAGIAVGTIYNYFDDKEQLFDALFQRRREELFEVIDAAAKAHSKDPFEAQLDAFVRAVFGHFDGRRAFLRLAMEADAARPQSVRRKEGGKQPAMQQLLERAARVVRIGVREKNLRNEDVDLLAAVLTSIVRGVLVLRAPSDSPFALETERTISLFLEGARK